MTLTICALYFRTEYCVLRRPKVGLNFLKQNKRLLVSTLTSDSEAFVSTYNHFYMELYYLRGSPWSLRVIWFIHALKENAFKDVKLSAITSADSLASKVKSSGQHKINDSLNKTYTLPMLFYPTKGGKLKVIREGIEIIEFFCEKYKETNELASTFIDNKSDMIKWNNLSDKLGRNFRNIFASYGYDFAYYMAPTFVTYIPGLSSLIGLYLLSGLNKKYSALGSEYKLGIIINFTLLL